MRIIPSDELIINQDGSVFHLHLRPEQLADTVILVGDPGRVDRIAAYFDKIVTQAANREFKTVTGVYKNKKISVVSTGIGTDNIDIVLNELDALANIDLATRTVKPETKQLTLLRLGTSGALQPDLKIGDHVLARTSIGFDGLLNFYAGRNEICNLDMEQAFVHHTNWNSLLAHPYFIDCDSALASLFSDVTREGMTISAPGFYAPQGRFLRIAPADPSLNEKLESFRYNDRKITNFEMESSALAGLSRLMGHRAATICTIIAQRVAGDADTDYQPFVDKMIVMSLDKLASI